jgi:hypothetical protein
MLFKITIEENMTITISLLPETETRLLARAAATGKDINTLVQEAIGEKFHTPLPTFQEVPAPVHEDFRKSGMTEAELDALYGTRSPRCAKNGGRDGVKPDERARRL